MPYIRTEMTKPRIYVYKITFLEVPHYYYGSHLEKKFDEEYWGSPVTHKNYWEIYTPQKEIIKEFSFTDEGYIEAQKYENNLIKPVYNTDPLCLNEHCGGVISLEACKSGSRKAKNFKLGIFGLSKDQRKKNGEKGGKISGENNKKNGIGFFGMTPEEKSNAGKKGAEKNRENGTGVFGMSPEERCEAGKKGGKTSYEKGVGIHNRSKEQMTEDGKKGGKIAGETHKKNGTGIFAMTSEEKSNAGKKGGKKAGKISCSQIWECTITNYRANPGNLAKYQKKRGIDTSNRIRIQ
jgi:general stress protein YciG